MMFSIFIFGYAAILVITGLTFQCLADTKDVAFLTPVFFAGLLIIMGVMSLKDDLKLYGQHGATGLSVLAFITSVGSFLKLITFSFNEISYLDMSDFIVALCSILFTTLAVVRLGRNRRLKEDAPQK